MFGLFLEKFGNWQYLSAKSDTLSLGISKLFFVAKLADLRFSLNCIVAKTRGHGLYFGSGLLISKYV